MLIQLLCGPIGQDQFRWNHLENNKQPKQQIILLMIEQEAKVYIFPFCGIPILLRKYENILLGNRYCESFLPLHSQLLLIIPQICQYLLMGGEQENYISHSLNNSASKAVRSFGKGTRFLKIHRLQTEMKYNLPSTIESKPRGMGYGQKIFLADKHHSPPPGTYDIQGTFSINRNKTRSPSFGLDRQKVIFGSYLTQAKKKAEKTPAPSRYDIRLPKCHKGGSMGLRLQTDPDSHRKVPGPGAYDLTAVAMSNSSSFCLSTFKKATSPKYFKSHTIDATRPSNVAKFYDIEQKEFGKSRVSKFRNASVSTFSKEKKMSAIDKWKLQVPGFKYNIFSEFGKCK